SCGGDDNSVHTHARRKRGYYLMDVVSTSGNSIGTELTRQLQLFSIDINADYSASSCFQYLHRELPEETETNHRHRLAQPGVRNPTPCSAIAPTVTYAASSRETLSGTL